MVKPVAEQVRYYLATSNCIDAGVCRNLPCECAEGAAKIAIEAAAQNCEDRIARAVAALNEAPDIGRGTPTKCQAEAIADANQRAWTILTEGMDPPSRRRAEDAP